MTDKLPLISGVGPGIGALIAVAFYKLIKVLEYEVSHDRCSYIRACKIRHEAVFSTELTCFMRLRWPTLVPMEMRTMIQLRIRPKGQSWQPEEG